MESFLWSYSIHFSYQHAIKTISSRDFSIDLYDDGKFEQWLFLSKHKKRRLHSSIDFHLNEEALFLSPLFIDEYQPIDISSSINFIRNAKLSF